MNRVKKHTRIRTTQRGAKTGGIVTQEAAIHVSNVMVVDPDGKPTRVGYRIDENGQKIRVSRRTGKDLLMTTRDRDRPCRGSRSATATRSPAQLREQFSYANPMQVPRLVKIVVNMGVGEAARDAKLIDGAVRDLTAITGQKPQIRRATKSIAQFKLREGMPIGAKVTLRGDRMWEFLDRLLSIALPRIRDFRGLDGRKLDGHGNYTFGLTEQSVFHEIDQDRIDRVRGMDITVVTTANTDDEGRALLKLLGLPVQGELSSMSE